MEYKEQLSHVKVSKFLSFILRHSPEKIQLSIDSNGWANIDELIDNANRYKNMHLTIDSIMEDGLKPMSRQHVHLSQTEETAMAVGKRHGKPIILCIDAKKMHEEGYKFYLSENKIGLVDKVPREYINMI